MTRSQHRKYGRRLWAYWPHAGVFVGISLNVLGLATVMPDLIATGSNVLTISGLYLVQRRRNSQRDDER
jgi:hypothetical protein